MVGESQKNSPIVLFEYFLYVCQGPNDPETIEETFDLFVCLSPHQWLDSAPRAYVADMKPKEIVGSHEALMEQNEAPGSKNKSIL